jgi:hypothetical protein
MVRSHVEPYPDNKDWTRIEVKVPKHHLRHCCISYPLKKSYVGGSFRFNEEIELSPLSGKLRIQDRSGSDQWLFLNDVVVERRNGNLAEHANRAVSKAHFVVAFPPAWSGYFEPALTIC